MSHHPALPTVDLPWLRPSEAEAAASFASLGADFATPCAPTPLPNAHWVGCNEPLRAALGLPAALWQQPEALALFTGNLEAQGGRSYASVYSGHQFGQWAGQLGDGRALNLGALNTPEGLQELQLKGAGPTPYSRRGDGRAVLRSSIREFLASEAMHGLGIPTTRALCVTGSPAQVRRESVETAAVVTRVAPSFVRFGHFEHFSANDEIDALRALADHVSAHLAAPDPRALCACATPLCAGATPPCATPAPALQAQSGAARYVALLHEVTQRTAALMAQWQAVGFCHGVMNTDNMSVLGLTLDYGPFQFMDGFDANHICNHSDTSGRYAYGRQPQMAYWNLFCLGQALLPLMDDQATAIAVLERYQHSFPSALEQAMRNKLGLPDAHESDRALVQDLLQAMQQDRVDYTVFWRRLSLAVRESTHSRHAFEPVRDLFLHREVFDTWRARYLERLGPCHRQTVGDAMLRTNPKYILRNHLGELAIAQAKTGDFSMVQNLLQVLHTPFDEHPTFEPWAGLAPEWAASIEISCSS